MFLPVHLGESALSSRGRGMDGLVSPDTRGGRGGGSSAPGLVSSFASIC